MPNKSWPCNRKTKEIRETTAFSNFFIIQDGATLTVSFQRPKFVLQSVYKNSNSNHIVTFNLF